jgi:hypothetical protein
MLGNTLARSEQTQSLVVDLASFRKSRAQYKSATTPARRFADGGSHVYVDLSRSGTLDYGLAGTNGENALLMLNALLYLAGQLTKISLDEVSQ